MPESVCICMKERDRRKEKEIEKATPNQQVSLLQFPLLHNPLSSNTLYCHNPGHTCTQCVFQIARAETGHERVNFFCVSLSCCTMELVPKGACWRKCIVPWMCVNGLLKMTELGNQSPTPPFSSSVQSGSRWATPLIDMVVGPSLPVYLSPYFTPTSLCGQYNRISI